jgi:hypothetical protein
MLVIECGEAVMAKRPTTESIAEGLTAAERVLLFCIGSDSDWQKAGVKHATPYR